MPNISEDLRRIREAKYGEEVRSSIHDSIRDINEVVENNVSVVTEITNQAKSYRDESNASATNAANSAATATEKADNASSSAAIATSKATEASTYAATATQKADDASNSAIAATQQANIATEKANDATNSAVLATEKADNASSSAAIATSKATEASNYATTVTQKADEASNSVVAATQQANIATEKANNAASSANKAEEWYDKTKNVSDSISGGFRPHGVIEFADLPAVTDVQAGDSYCISNAFTTTSDFKGGAGKSISAGANVYMTIDSKWDILPINNNIRVENGTLFITPGAV